MSKSTAITILTITCIFALIGSVCAGRVSGHNKAIEEIEGTK